MQIFVLATRPITPLLAHQSPAAYRAGNIRLDPYLGTPPRSFIIASRIIVFTSSYFW